MARPTNAERDAKIHEEARAGFERQWAGCQETRRQCQEDRRFTFVPGAQWEGPIGEQFENKPKPEVNKVFMALRRLRSEYRNNRITADFVPKDGATNLS